MRKLIVLVSAMALPLAACGQEQSAPPEADPAQQVIEEPAMPPEEGVIEDGGTDEGDVEEGTAEEGAADKGTGEKGTVSADKTAEDKTVAE